MKIKDIMSKNIISANENSSVYEISKLMKEYNIGFIPIINKKLIGVITDRDIVIKCIFNKDNNSVKSYITTSIISIDEDKDIIEALKLMSTNKIKRLIVTKNNKVTGILSLSDIINTNSLDNELINCFRNIYAINNNLKLINNKIDDIYL